MTAAPTLAIFDGIGFSEMLVIGFISILVFGGRLPEVMRNLGQSYARIRRAIQDMSKPLREEIQRATTLPPEPAHPIVAVPAPDSVPVYNVVADDASPTWPAPAPSPFPGAPSQGRPSLPAAAATPAPWLDEPPPV